MRRLVHRLLKILAESVHFLKNFLSYPVGLVLAYVTKKKNKMMLSRLFLALRVAALQTRPRAPGVGWHVGALEVVAGPGGGVDGAGSGRSRHCGGSGTGVGE